MQYSENIPITAAFLNTLTGDCAERKAAIKLQLDDLHAGIASLLSSYHWSEKGSVDTLRIDEASINIDKTGNGQFKVAYAINITYGCSDISIDLDQAMIIKINTDLANQKATITGEYIPEREPDF